MATVVFPVRSYIALRNSWAIDPLKAEREEGIIIIIIIIIMTGKLMYCSESSQALPACPLVKIGWRKGRALGSEESRVVGSGLMGVCRRGGKLSNWAKILNVFIGVD
jgi:hypothetical protein